MKEIDYTGREYDVFRMFHERWALGTAGTMEDFNTLTIGWGSLGTLWASRESNGHIVTIYVTPARYTYNYLEQNDWFTVSFFPEECRKDLAYLGSHSGRDEDKVAHTSLTPVAVGDSVGFEEAELTFLCRKIYSDAFDGDRAPAEIRDGLYTKVEPHHFYIGKIEKVFEKD